MADNGNQGSIRRLDTREFASAKDEFRRAVEEYIEAKQKLADTTNTLLDSWRGKGRQTFQNKYTLFSGKLEDLQDVLNDYNDTFVSVLDAYSTTDEDIADSIAAQSGAGGGGGMGGRGGTGDDMGGSTAPSSPGAGGGGGGSSGGRFTDSTSTPGGTGGGGGSAGGRF